MSEVELKVENGGLLDKESILKNTRLRVEKVDVPEWGGSVLVKEMTASERDRFEASLLKNTWDGKGKEMSTEDIRAKLCALVIVNAKHEPIFREADIPALGSMSAGALDRVYAVAMRLSGLSKGDVEELAKNSQSDRGDGQ
jgi:hypothetical protein